MASINIKSSFALKEKKALHKDLDYEVLSIMTFKYLEIFFFWNRISLDLNYSRLAGTLLTVIAEMFNSEGQRV